MLLWGKWKERAGKEQSPGEPCRPQGAAEMTTAELQMVTKLHRNCQALQPHSCKVRPRKGSTDCLQSPVRSHRVLSCPCVSIVFGLGIGGGKLNHEPPWLTASAFLYTTWLSWKPVAISPLSGKTTPGAVFGKCFPLLSGEYSFFWVKHSLSLILLWLSWFFHKLWFHLTVSPSVYSTIRRGGGTSWVG